MRTILAKSLMPALLGLALASGATAKADEQHHESDVTNPAPSATMRGQQPGTMPSTQMMGPMMNMMRPSASGMPMMSMPMMNMIGPGGVGMMGAGAMPMQGMPMPDMGAHLEGRIAFLRAELGVTEAQMPQWEAF